MPEQILVPSADTYTNYANQNPSPSVGDSVRFSVQGDANYWRHALIRFYPIVVPEGEEIVQAKLRLNVDSKTGTGGVDLYKTAGGWPEATTNWTNEPVSGDFLGKQTVPAAGQWIEWDVTSGLNATTGSNQMNFVLQTGDPGYYGFRSSEAVDSTLRPQLVLTTNVIGETEPPPPPPDGDGTTAADTLNWGSVIGGDEFTGSAIDTSKWSLYNSAGHAGNGLRRPEAWSVQDGYARVSGDANGTTGGMSAKYPGADAKYGRWEARIRASDSESKYHPVLILWPASGNWPTDGEIDFAERPGGSTNQNKVSFYLHYSSTNQQTQTSKTHDWSQWHNFAVDWTADAVVGYVDGVEWFRDEDKSHLPPGPMHLTAQLDWFPVSGQSTTPSTLDIAWVRQYAPAGSTPPPPPPTGDVRIAACGDMNGVRTTSSTSASYKNGKAIGDELEAGTVDHFFGLGDFQYDIGYRADLVNYWLPGWSRTKSKLWWISAPNHDWQPGRNSDLAPFMNGEFSESPVKSAANQAKGTLTNGQPYSQDFGNWHFAFLSTALWRYDVPAAQAVTTWLDADLADAKARGKHLGVCYHDPYFTSATSSHDRETDVKPWIDVMYKHRVKLTLSGSQHNYERSYPVSNTDAQVSDGMTAFQVSTGGIGLRSFTSNPSYIAKKFSDTWGYLVLTLHDDGSFDWVFKRTSGGSNTDSGSRS